MARRIYKGCTIEHRLNLPVTNIEDLEYLSILLHTKGDNDIIKTYPNDISFENDEFIFTISSDELKKFSQEAKKYGILYCALANKNNSKIDGMVDIMIKEEDAGKMNRIAERFNFKDVATIKKEMEKDKEEKLAKLAGKSEDEIFIDEIMPTSKEEEKQIPSDDKQKTEKKNQLESSLNTKQNDKQTEKPSVLKELDDIKRQMGKKGKHYKEQENKKEKPKSKNKGKRYKEPKHYKEKTKKSKERGK